MPGYFRSSSYLTPIGQMMAGEQNKNEKKAAASKASKTAMGSNEMITREGNGSGAGVVPAPEATEPNRNRPSQTEFVEF